MVQRKFGTRRRAMLSFERQPFPAPCHVDQDIAHSQAWRALGHLTTFNRVLSALHRRNHLPLPRTFSPGQCCHGQQGVVSIVSRPLVHFGPNSDLCATAYLCALLVAAIFLRHHALGTIVTTITIVSNECRGAAMKCLACGAVMRLMDVRTDATTPFAIKRRMFQCSSCRQTAQRLEFDRSGLKLISELP
jgi:hypothetical protein